MAQSLEESKLITLSFCVRDALWLYKLNRGFEKIIETKAVDTVFNVVIEEDN